MPRRVTMSSLVALCQELADLEGDDHIKPEGWKSRLDMVYGDLVEEVSLTGYRYFEYSTDVVADGSESYDEVADHMSTVSIVRVIDDSGRVSDPLLELNPGEEQQYAGVTGDAVAYQLIDDQLYLYPRPSSGTYRWRYIPQPTDISEYADDDVVDVVAPSGKAFLAWGAVASAKSKSESDLRFALQQQEAAREKLQVWCSSRSMQGRRRAQAADVDDVISVPEGRYR